MMDDNVLEFRREPKVPFREPDLQLDIWVKDGEVDWVSASGTGDVPEEDVLPACLDAAWTISKMDEATGGGPALWWFIDYAKPAVLLRSTVMPESLGWRWAWWLLRSWARMSKHVLLLAWRAAWRRK